MITVEPFEDTPTSALAGRINGKKVISVHFNPKDGEISTIIFDAHCHNSKDASEIIKCFSQTLKKVKELKKLQT